MSTVVRRHVESATELSKELQERTTDIRDVDIKVDALLESLEGNVRELLKARHAGNSRRPTKKQKTNMANLEEKIKSEEGTCVELSNEKTGKATEMYDKVDKLITKVDRSLKQLETDMERDTARLGLIVGQKVGLALTPPQPLTRGARPKTNTRPGFSHRGRAGRLKRKNMDSLPAPFLGAVPEQPGLPLTSGPEFDSVEPKYCRCNQVSYGEMVGCDGVDCPIEWFHFECVGLKEKPKGKWYCPECTERRLSAKGGRR
ncbi:hypothetical protein BSKO_02975 [Bryopsis sp. KO-2023]|nr:hypothetical protein BSKO_02975 [Bryopsis sp. KO-2023]